MTHLTSSPSSPLPSTTPTAVSSPAHSNLDLTRFNSPQHDSTRADLSYPFETTNVNPVGQLNEYRARSPTGLIPERYLETIASRTSEQTHTRTVIDVEKGGKTKESKGFQFVTWKVDDPEDPRNWSNLYRWCTSSCLLIITPKLADRQYQQILPLYARSPSYKWHSQVLSLLVISRG